MDYPSSESLDRPLPTQFAVVQQHHLLSGTLDRAQHMTDDNGSPSIDASSSPSNLQCEWRPLGQKNSKPIEEKQELAEPAGSSIMALAKLTRFCIPQTVLRHQSSVPAKPTASKQRATRSLISVHSAGHPIQQKANVVQHG